MLWGGATGPAWVLSTMFTHLATGFHQMPTRNMKSEEYNKNQSPCIKEENDVGKAGQSCIWSRPVASSVVQKGKLPVAIYKTYNRRNKTWNQHHRTHCYKILQNTPVPSCLTVYRCSSWALHMISVVRMQILDSCLLVRGVRKGHLAASLPLVTRWIDCASFSCQKHLWKFLLPALTLLV